MICFVQNRLGLFLVLTAVLLTSCDHNDLLKSPDGNISVDFNVSPDLEATYSISYKNTEVLKESGLGLKTSAGDFTRLSLIGSEKTTVVEDHYTLVHGKKHTISYKASRKVFHLQNEAGDKLDIIFQVSDDGVGFRYYFPERSEAPIEVTAELTSFHFPDSTRSWLQPMSAAKTGWRATNPSYEEYYHQAIAPGTPAPLGAGWVYPALFNVGDTWLLITETDLRGTYCGSRLVAKPGSAAMQVAFPQPQEIFPGGGLLPKSASPWYTPWRVIAVGSLATIVESTLGTDLAKPAVAVDTAILKPGYASWSWALLKDHSITYDIQRDFIDYAAEMNWSYCLVDVNWDTTIGYTRMKELSEYALDRGVGLLLWYNSSGSWNSTDYHPKSRLLTHEQRVKEFSKLKEMGIKGVKIDFFGGDGQSMIRYYHELLRDAGEFGLLVNFHGCTLPRGWHRTYPNLMTMEAVRGFEFITFTQDNADKAPAHCAILPFTRNVFDPMDFTPMSLHKIPGITRSTTNAFELALPTLFLSGIQHMAETPEGMATVPGYIREYLRSLPVRWDETKFVDGYPGKLVIIARRSGDYWYISGINGENIRKQVRPDLGFIGNASGFLITDGEQEGSFKKEPVLLGAVNPEITLQGNGGFVLKVKVD